jgi:hypothetical protein
MAATRKDYAMFNNAELTEIKEIARLALQDGEFFDRIAEECDLSDEYLMGLRDKLEKDMEENSK